MLYNSETQTLVHIVEVSVIGGSSFLEVPLYIVQILYTELSVSNVT